MSQDKKINLFIITPSLECGGAERYVAWLCNSINKSKFCVTLIVVNNLNPFYEIKNDVTLIDLKKEKSSSSIFKIINYINQNKPNIVYSTANHLNLLLALCKPFISSKVKLIAWETSIVSINHTFSKHPKLYNFLLKSFYKKLPLVICQSNYMQQDLLDNYGFNKTQTKVIYTGIEKPQKSQIDSSSSMPIFLTIARLSAEKQIDKILNALSLLKTQYKYIIIGDGLQRKNLESLTTKLNLRDKVQFRGQLENPYENISNANLFLMASKYEGLPTSLIEASMLGIPIVATNAPGGIAEVVENGINGFLVNEYSTEAYAKTIGKALAYNFGVNKIEALAKEKFNAQKCLHQIQEVFIKTCNQ